MFDFTQVRSQMSWVFRPDHSLALTISASGPATMVFPDACLATDTPPVACTDVSIGAAYQVRFEGGTASTPSCHDAGGACTCTLSLTAAPATQPGTYQTTGPTLTVMSGGQATVIDYCATATSLKMRFHNSDGTVGDVMLFDPQ
jgi:hypothetical protein